MMQGSCSSYNSPTSSKLFKHQVEFVFLFKELHQLQDIASGKIKSTVSHWQQSQYQHKISVISALWARGLRGFNRLRYSTNWVSQSLVPSPIRWHYFTWSWQKAITCGPGTDRASQPHGRHGCGCDLVSSQWSGTEHYGSVTLSKNSPLNKWVPLSCFPQ